MSLSTKGHPNEYRGRFQRVFHDVIGMKSQLPLGASLAQAMSTTAAAARPHRFGMLLKNASDLCGLAFPCSGRGEGGKCVRGINAEGCADMTRKQIDSLRAGFVRTYRAKGWPMLTYTADGEVKSSFNKFLTPEFCRETAQRFAASRATYSSLWPTRTRWPSRSGRAAHRDRPPPRPHVPEGVATTVSG